MNLLLRGYIICLISYCGWVVSLPVANVAIARSINPLTIERSDPLIPKGYGKRSLTSWEKSRLERKIEELEETATAKLKRNDLEEAMQLWYRQLRLLRILDLQKEIEALGRVGEIAWQENRSTDLRNIANRLLEIQLEISHQSPSASHNLLAELGNAYRRVRYLDRAVNVYEQIALKGQKSPSANKEFETLEILGELYLARFDYQNAEEIYQTLLTKNTEKNRSQYQQTLIKIYDRSNQIDKAIAARKDLIKQYTKEQKIFPLAALNMAIARDYESLSYFPQAIESYNRAWEIASNNQQFSLAGDALKRIGMLQQQQNNFNRAISTYRQLATIQQQADDDYGLIDTYDLLGNIYLKLDRQQEAQQYFDRALRLEKTINYRDLQVYE